MVKSESTNPKEEAMSSAEVPTTYKDLAKALQELSVDPNQHLYEEIIYQYEGVRLYFLSPDREVLTTLEPQLLKISLVQGDDANTPRAILQVGDWIYPLIPGVSPYYRTDYGAFILPDIYSNVEGSSISIILPSDADEDVFDCLEAILHRITSQKTEEEICEERETSEEPEHLSTWLSNKLVNGAWYISENLIKGAHKAEEFLNRGTPVLISNMPKSRRPADIPAPVFTSVRIAEDATGGVVKVTGFLAEKVSQGTVKLGQFLAPHIEKQGTKLLASGFSMPEDEASNNMKGILTVAAGAAEGFSTVYRGLETFAVILGNSLKNNTVKVVEHKYGSTAAQTTEVSLNVLGNAYATYQNTRILRPSRLAKTTAKEAVLAGKDQTQGKGIVSQYSTTLQGNRDLMNALETNPATVNNAEGSTKE
ncbi:spartin isoform X2 [Rhynchophorus ferrugineus]|uniref:spartin isoform X2 n=1 Tax=Rhynchophorus ferrugineus TaxID=354439 RepID=UPI003FCE0759